MKKVLSVTSYLLNEDAASWRALNLARALGDRGFDVEVAQYVKKRATANRAEYPERLNGVRTRVVRSSRLSCLFKHLRYIRTGGHDVVIGNNINGTLFSILGRLRRPLILDMHGDLLEELRLSNAVEGRGAALRNLPRLSIYRLVNFLTFRASNRISCVSRRMIDFLERQGIPRRKAIYAPNCVDLEMFRPRAQTEPAVRALREELGIRADQRVLGYVGRFQPWQGADNLIEAARTIRDPNVVFLMVGAEHAGREANLRFVPEVPVGNVPLYYAACDGLVLPRPDHPATQMAAPTKFAEYAAMGRPILTSNVGDAADMVAEYGCGVVVRDNSVEELAGGLRQMATLERETCEAMGAKARVLAEREFDFSVTVKNYTDCIVELTQAPQAAVAQG